MFREGEDIKIRKNRDTRWCIPWVGHIIKTFVVTSGENMLLVQLSSDHWEIIEVKHAEKIVKK